MKWLLLVLGIALLAAGVAAIAHSTITYHQKEEVAKIGPIQATVDKEKTVEIPRAFSLLGVAAGLSLIVLGARRKS